MNCKTAQEFSAAVDGFIAACEAGSIPRPTDYRFCTFAGIRPEQLDLMYLGTAPGGEDDAGYYESCAEALKKLIRYREDRLIGVIEDNPKATSAALFLLRQKRNGGYTDKQSDEKSGGIRISLSLKDSEGDNFER